MRYKFNQPVEVTRGFYKGMQGRVKRRDLFGMFYDVGCGFAPAYTYHIFGFWQLKPINTQTMFIS